MFKGSFALNVIVVPFQNTCNLQQNSLLKCKIFIILITEKKSLKKKITEKKRKCSFKTCVMFIRETKKREKDTWAYGI